MNILCIIPARGGSKRLKNKNILKINGKPLIGYTIESALASKLIDKIVVSTDSKKIAKVVRNLYSNVEVINRPREYAKDDSPIEESLLHAVEYLKEKNESTFDYIVELQANVPIRKNGIIDEAIKKTIETNADSCVTCYEVGQIPELMKIINKNGFIIPIYRNVYGIRYQEFPKRYLLDGSVNVLRTINLFKTRGIRKTHIYLGKKIVPIIQEKNMYSLEIDTADELFTFKCYLESYGINKQRK